MTRQTHSLTDATIMRLATPGTKVIVFDAYGSNPHRATVIKHLGSMIISDTERGIRLSSSPWRTWLADDLFEPVEYRK